MTTLFDYMVDTLRLLGGLRTGLVTGGDDTNIIDTVNRDEDDDYWNGGMIYIITTTDGLAPQAEHRLISDFDNATNTVIVASVLSAVVTANDRYAVSEAHYPHDVLIDCINLAIKQFRYQRIDTTLVVVADQTEYDIPSGIQQGRIKEVYIQTNVDSNDNRWRKIGEWWSTDDGTDQKLIIPKGLTTGRTIRIDYDYIHIDLDSGSDAIPDFLEPKYVIFRAAEYMLLHQMHDGDEWPFLQDRMNYFMAKADEYEKEFIAKIKEHRRGA